VTILATSRQPMSVPGEHCCPVPPLPVPEPEPSLSSASRASASRGGAGRGGCGGAVELFAQRAAAAGFAVTPANCREVILLCGRLDGIPLAIELAAVQLRTLTLSQLSSRLEHRFGLLTSGHRGALPHQQTLRATTQWSYDLCSAAEQLLWARLSVFAGSFELAAAEALCAGGPLAREDILPTLIGLVDKSVVLRTEEDAARYWLLGTIRRVRRGHRPGRGLSLGSGVPRPPGSSLRRLVFGREELDHQSGELAPLRMCQGFQDLLLNTIDDGVEFPELVDSGRGDGDDVAAPVPGVDGPLDEPA
jgi:hypothetical protein